MARCRVRWDACGAVSGPVGCLRRSLRSGGGVRSAYGRWVGRGRVGGVRPRTGADHVARTGCGARTRRPLRAATPAPTPPAVRDPRAVTAVTLPLPRAAAAAALPLPRAAAAAALPLPRAVVPLGRHGWARRHPASAGLREHPPAHTNRGHPATRRGCGPRDQSTRSTPQNPGRADRLPAHAHAGHPASTGRPLAHTGAPEPPPTPGVSATPPAGCPAAAPTPQPAAPHPAGTAPP